MFEVTQGQKIQRKCQILIFCCCKKSFWGHQRSNEVTNSEKYDKFWYQLVASTFDSRNFVKMSKLKTHFNDSESLRILVGDRQIVNVDIKIYTKDFLKFENFNSNRPLEIARLDKLKNKFRCLTCFWTEKIFETKFLLTSVLLSELDPRFQKKNEFFPCSRIYSLPQAWSIFQ